MKSAEIDSAEDYNDEGIRRMAVWDILAMRDQRFYGDTFASVSTEEPMWLRQKQEVRSSWSGR
jgi:hypothetical protein